MVKVEFKLWESKCAYKVGLKSTACHEFFVNRNINPYYLQQEQMSRQKVAL